METAKTLDTNSFFGLAPSILKEKLNEMKMNLCYLGAV